WPSRRPVRPERSTALTCTNTSAPPSSGAMKPNPLAMLNHLTVPVAIGATPQKRTASEASRPDSWFEDECRAQMGARSERHDRLVRGHWGAGAAMSQEKARPSAPAGTGRSAHARGQEI